MPLPRTYVATPKDIEKKWFVIDATDLVLGRLASLVAMRVRGKHKPTYTPNMDCGDHIVVVNAEKVHLTGNKRTAKTYYWHTGYPGGIKSRTADKVLDGRFPNRVIEKTDDSARTAWASGHAQFACLCRSKPPASSPAAGGARYCRHECKECEVVMAEETQKTAPQAEGLAALETLAADAPVAAVVTAPAEPKIDNLGRSYATGRRKDAAARVWVKRGTGQITINGRKVETYFARPVLQMILAQPFEATARVGEFDVIATVRGGGLSGQAGAVRHGISRALTLFEPGLRPALKAGGFLTRDPRVVERKKYGKAKARRSFQFSKR